MEFGGEVQFVKFDNEGRGVWIQSKVINSWEFDFFLWLLLLNPRLAIDY